MARARSRQRVAAASNERETDDRSPCGANVAWTIARERIRLRAPMALAGVDLQLRAPAAAAVALRDDTAINDPHNEAMGKPLAQINLVTNDMAAAVEFYRLLGWEFEVTPDGAHAATQIAPGVRVELDTTKFASVWNAGAVAASGRTLLIASMDTRIEVDTVFAGIVDMGHAVVQRPYDAFWGARFAIVADPGGKSDRTHEPNG